MDSFQAHMIILGLGIVVGVTWLAILEIDKRRKKGGR
jgi:hypothetical protein